jgi:hypothetical protein
MGLIKVMLFKLWNAEPKRDIDNYRTDGGTLETVDHSYYVETEEKVMYNTNTKEVRIR